MYVELERKVLYRFKRSCDCRQVGSGELCGAAVCSQVRPQHDKCVCVWNTNTYLDTFPFLSKISNAKLHTVEKTLKELKSN